MTETKTGWPTLHLKRALKPKPNPKIRHQHSTHKTPKAAVTEQGGLNEKVQNELRGRVDVKRRNAKKQKREAKAALSEYLDPRMVDKLRSHTK